MLKYFLSIIGYLCPIALSYVLTSSQQKLFFSLPAVANLVTNLILALTLVILSHTPKHRGLRLKLATFALVVFNIYLLADLVHFCIAKSHFSQSTIFLLFETYPSEIREFITFFINPKIILISLFFIVCTFFSVTYLRILNKSKAPSLLALRAKIPFIPMRVGLVHTWLFLIISIAPFIRADHNRLRYFTPYALCNGYFAYMEEWKASKSETQISLGGDFENVYHTDSSNSTYVLVIGESTARSHMSIYGYGRATTPHLESIKGELIVFRDIITPHTHTIPALAEALTLSSSNNSSSDKYKGSIPQLFNHAGFETFWISNQPPFGLYETFVSRIARASDHHFFNAADYYSFDDDLLQPIQNALKNKSKNKFIIVHLMGTHINYRNRYPADYNIFKDAPKTKFQHKLAFNTINAYDNAVLFNDFVVSEIINLVKINSENAWVLYFSDHGEDVYETSNSASHTAQLGTKPMYEVPFVLWMSEAYKDAHSSLVFNEQRCYMTDHLIHSLSDLADIRHNLHRPENSLFHINYIKPSRKLKNGKVY